MIFLSLLAAGLAIAAPACPPFGTAGFKVTRCEDNFLLGRMADQCLFLYTKELSARKTKVGAAAGDTQKESYNQAGAALDSATQELDRLIKQGEEAKLAVDSYFANMHFPEDLDNPALTGLTSEKYLATEPCFAAPKQVMNENSEMIGLMLQDLKQVRDQALSKKIKTGTQAENVGSKGNVTLTPPARTPQQPAGPKQLPGIRPSDISGTEEKKK